MTLENILYILSGIVLGFVLAYCLVMGWHESVKSYRKLQMRKPK